MRGRLALILLGAMLTACSSQSDTQLEGVKTARSVLGEWAWVEEQSNKDNTPSTYTEQMREMAREQLKSTKTELKGQPQAQNLVEQMRSGAPDARALQQAQDALDPLETQLESS